MSIQSAFSESSYSSIFLFKYAQYLVYKTLMLKLHWF